MIIPNITIGGMRANLLLLDNGNLAVVVDTKTDDDGGVAIDVYHQKLNYLQTSSLTNEELDVQSRSNLHSRFALHFDTNSQLKNSGNLQNNNLVVADVSQTTLSVAEGEDIWSVAFNHFGSGNVEGTQIDINISHLDLFPTDGNQSAAVRDPFVKFLDESTFVMLAVFNQDMDGNTNGSEGEKRMLGQAFNISGETIGNVFFIDQVEHHTIFTMGS